MLQVRLLLSYWDSGGLRQLILQGSVAGQCGAVTTSTISVTAPTGYIINVPQSGQQNSQTIILSSDGNYITTTDNTDNACSGSAQRVTGQSNDASDYAAAHWSLALVLATAALTVNQ